MKNAIYLCKLHTRWIANHCPIRLCVPSILDQLRVPYPEVLFGLFPLWEDGNDRPQVPAISCVFQVFLEDFKHFSRGRHVTSVEYLVRRNLQRSLMVLFGWFKWIDQFFGLYSFWNFSPSCFFSRGTWIKSMFRISFESIQKHKSNFRKKRNSFFEFSQTFTSAYNR